MSRAIRTRRTAPCSLTSEGRLESFVPRLVSSTDDATDRQLAHAHGWFDRPAGWQESIGSARSTATTGDTSATGPALPSEPTHARAERVRRWLRLLHHRQVVSENHFHQVISVSDSVGSRPPAVRHRAGRRRTGLIGAGRSSCLWQRVIVAYFTGSGRLQGQFSTGRLRHAGAERHRHRLPQGTGPGAVLGQRHRRVRDSGVRRRRDRATGLVWVHPGNRSEASPSMGRDRRCSSTRSRRRRSRRIAFIWTSRSPTGWQRSNG